MFQETITPEEIEQMDLAAFPGRINIITCPGEGLDHAIEHLSAQRLIGFDTETKPVFQAHQPRHHTALLQLSSETEAFLFRLQELGLPQAIADIMADPHITKIGAAVGEDIHGLQYYCRFEPHRFMDLQSFGSQYGIKEKSVRKMAAIILGQKVSKAQQCSNWEAQPLSEAQQLYAATDAWICVKMYKALLASPRMVLPNGAAL
ncbi:MAG: 3'-5' exonuclease domain-containing protein 2 [Bacteroidales bacterium]|nr:3'-5' exonuclease domain-containing protein 2 [Bacteroidales bacterium]